MCRLITLRSTWGAKSWSWSCFTRFVLVSPGPDASNSIVRCMLKLFKGIAKKQIFHTVVFNVQREKTKLLGMQVAVAPRMTREATSCQVRTPIRIFRFDLVSPGCSLFWNRPSEPLPSHPRLPLFPVGSSGIDKPLWSNLGNLAGNEFSARERVKSFPFCCADRGRKKTL